MKLQPISLNRVSDSIVEQIKTFMAEGKLKPGDRLPNERDLGEQCGVGRSSVREAMIALDALGLIRRTREGTFVSSDLSKLVWCRLDAGGELSRSTIRDVFETRRLIEVGIAGLAAERATPEAIEEIRQGVPDQMGDLETFKRLDLHFHAAIARAAGNPFVYELYTKVQEVLFQTHRYYAALEEFDPRSSAALYEFIHRQHLAILKAIEEKDPVAAQEAMLAHFTALEQTMLRDPDSQGENTDGVS